MAQASEQASSASSDNSSSTSPEPKQRSRTSFISKLLKLKSNDEEESFESTAMYRVTQAAGGKATGGGCEARALGRQGDGKDPNRDRDGGQAIADVSVSSSSPEGGLVAKQERLERAARLLGKDGERQGKG